MNEFRKYDSVERYGKEDTEGILNGVCWIFEKLDGANCSIFYNGENGITICSRNRILYSDKQGVIDEFRGLVNYVKSTLSLVDMVTNNPNYVFYGEYLIPHCVKYPIELQKKVYLYDIFRIDNGSYLPYELVRLIPEQYGIDYLKPLAVLTNPTIDECKQYLHINTMRGQPDQEGIVIKNYDFRNKFYRQCYAKIVNDQFKEVKSIEKKERLLDQIEEQIAGKYVTEARVGKIINKMLGYEKDQYYSISSSLPRLTEKDIPQILGMIYNDVIKEEMWTILKEYKNPTINFKNLQREIYNLTKVYFFKYLENNGGVE